MDWIPRELSGDFAQKLAPGKVYIIYGPRRTGKTSLIQHFLDEKPAARMFTGTGDDLSLREVLSSQRLATIEAAFAGYDLVFIDEAQRIPNIGWGLKLLIDHLPQTRVVVTGSSSFVLSHELSEPLTGRQHMATLYPVSIMEMLRHVGGMKVLQQLEHYLVYGMYPETLTTPNLEAKQEYLLQLRNAYLFKDILEMEKLRSAGKLADLLKLLAFQIGQEVSLNELGNSLGLAKQTVERYLDLLEKSFIIKKVGGFSRNLRKEVTKTARYYFFDNGVRNALINNFNGPQTRMDMGMLWENFCVMERLKKQEYHKLFSNNYFWRTYDQQEVDWVEEREGKLFGYEFKWNPRKQPRPPKAWLGTYANASFEVVTPENFLGFVS